MNSYDILGISRSSSKDEIKKAYHKLSLLYHPDRPNGNHDKFLKIKEAYEELIQFNPQHTHNIHTEARESYVHVYGHDYDHKTGEISIHVSFSRNMMYATLMDKTGYPHRWSLTGLNSGDLVIAKRVLLANDFRFAIYFISNRGKTIVKEFKFTDPRNSREKFKDGLTPLYFIRMFIRAVLFIVIYIIISNLF